MKKSNIKNLTVIILLLLSINMVGVAQTTDTDNDGIIDLYDIDDDNDGLTDVDEYAETIRVISDINSRGGGLSPYPIRVNQLTTSTYGELTELADGDFDYIGKAEGNSSYYNSSGLGLSIGNSTDGKPYIFLKTYNVNDFENSGNRIKSKIAFDNSVSHLSFSIRNFHSSAAVTVTAYYQGNPITITAANFTLIGNPHCSANNIRVYNGNSVVNNATDNLTYDNNTVNTAFVYIPELIDSVVIYSGRTSTSTGHTYFGIGDFKYIRQEGIDTDGDGYLNHLDLDSDNDGISDIVEAGGTDNNFDALVDCTLDSDGDGLVDEYDIDDTDGPLGSSACSDQPYCIQTVSTISATGRIDTDNNGEVNHLDIDSDGDNCFDLWEAYTQRSCIDSDLDGYFGTGVPAVDANGLVIGLLYNTNLVEAMIDADVSICSGIDYGDAPSSYGSTAQEDGAYHAVNNYTHSTYSSPLMLGSHIDLEDNSTNDDNAHAYSDEDAVSSFPTLTTTSSSYTLWVATTVVSEEEENSFTVAAWIDFNQDGDYKDAGEKASRTINSASSVGNTMSDDINTSGEVRLTWDLTDITPVSGDTYIRIRIATDASEVNEANGLAHDGEVEDHPLRVDDITPIKLLSFTAECDTYNTVVKWTTATEENNDYFTLEKSTDLQNWEELTIISGAGTSNNMLEYTFNDKVNSSTTYYRLTQTDFDGKYEVFSPISTDACMSQMENKEVNIYPNPATNNVNVQLIGFEDNKDYQILIYNAYGAIVYSTECKNSKSINTSNLKKGIYIVKITDNNETYNKSLIIN